MARQAHHPRVPRPKVGDTLVMKSGTRRRILRVDDTESGGWWVQFEGRVCLLTAGEFSTLVAKGARVEENNDA